MSQTEFSLATRRHSLAHVMAQAVQREIDMHVKLGIGPAIEHGAYYDFVFPGEHELTEDKLKQLHKTMQTIIKENQPFDLIQTNDQQSEALLKLTEQDYKLEMRQEFLEANEAITFYINTIPLAAKDKILSSVDPEYLKEYEIITDYIHHHFSGFEDRFVTFIDMCAGPHVETTSQIDKKSFALDKIAGAYRRGDENNIMMTRLYLLAFEDKSDLKAHLEMIAEAKRRDHRKLGQELKLFTLSPLVWAGLPLLQPNGMTIRHEIESYLWELHRDRGYQRVRTPHLAKEDLYQTSGHADKFGDELFRVAGKEDAFYMKPMNCPHHMQIFAHNQFSYRDMPVRYFEPGTVYRDEKTGQLSGLTRVRSITQDDGHLFCRVSQIREEVGSIVSIIKEFYTTLGMVQEYEVQLSVRGEDNKMYLWDDQVWETAETALEQAAQENELPYTRVEGEAAFYGPKLDFMFKDAIWRQWQLSTIQCDFNLPERFDLSYTNESGDKERPVVIHRAISGSLERFMGVMIEHFAGAFPARLAPIQAIVLPVADAFNTYGQSVIDELQCHHLRSKLDNSDDSLNKKIRNAEKMKIPYILVVGENELTDSTVSVREYQTKKQYVLPLQTFIDQLQQKVNQRSLWESD